MYWGKKNHFYFIINGFLLKQEMTEAGPTVIYGDHKVEGKRKAKVGYSLESWNQKKKKSKHTLMDLAVTSERVWRNVLLPLPC